MHPYEESFVIFDTSKNGGGGGGIAYVFRVDLEPTLTELFSRENMSFYFTRFCISLDRLSGDSDILEKIP